MASTTPNKFLSILKSIGAKFEIGAKKAVAVEAQLLPVEQAVAAGVSLVNPVAGTTISDLVGVVGQVEQVATAVGATSGTGTQKLAAALPGVEAAILSDPLFKGKTITNLDKYNSALTQITGAIADLADSFEGSVAAPVAVAPAPTPAPAPSQTPIPVVVSAIKVPASA